MPQNKMKSGGFQNFLHGQGRFGLDPLDTSRTAAGIEGWFIRKLITFRLRTRNILSLVMMLIFGVGITVFMGFAFYAAITTPIVGEVDFMVYVMFAVFYSILGLVCFIGIALLLNFGINIGIILGIIKVTSSKQEVSKSNGVKKKMTKRRKDFK